MLYHIYQGIYAGRTWYFNYEQDNETQVYESIMKDRDDITKSTINKGDYVYVDIMNVTFRKLIEFG